MAESEGVSLFCAIGERSREAGETCREMQVTNVQGRAVRPVCRPRAVRADRLGRGGPDIAGTRGARVIAGCWVDNESGSNGE
jgi:hypothetical protein